MRGCVLTVPALVLVLVPVPAVVVPLVLLFGVVGRVVTPALVFCLV